MCGGISTEKVVDDWCKLGKSLYQRRKDLVVIEVWKLSREEQNQLRLKKEGLTYVIKILTEEIERLEDEIRRCKSQLETARLDVTAFKEQLTKFDEEYKFDSI
jgi:polyhydroxyalkanoate synthesis regulator phasin